MNASDLTAVIDHPSGFFALSDRHQCFTPAHSTGFIAYRERGRHLLVFAGVHALPEARAPLLKQFLAEADRRGRRVLVVQLPQSQLKLFQAHGFTINQLGASFALQLADYSLAGTRKMKLRNKIQRARRAGLRVMELGREQPRNPAAFKRLQAISQAWLKAKGKPELDFMIGELGAPEDTRRRLFMVLDASDQALAFISYVPVWGSRPGYLHDLSRRLPTAPAGTMELCNVFALQRMQAEGVAYLHFGFTPFIVNGDEPPQASWLMARLARLLRRHGQCLYPAESQAAYKRKWGTQIEEPEYIAGRPLSLRAIWDLLLETRVF